MMISKNLRKLLLVLFASLFLAQCSKNDDEKFPFRIQSISPDTGPIGTTVTIKGRGFKPTHTVTFNGVEATVLSGTDTQIITEVPINATTGALMIHEGAIAPQTGPLFIVTEPRVTENYYIKFRVNGVLKVFEEDDPGYQTCGNCACSYMPALNESRNASIDVCQNDNDQVTGADIHSWNNKKILFNMNNVFPVASLRYKEDNVTFTTSSVPDQAESEANITGIIPDGSFLGSPAYRVTGTFKCKVARSDGSSVTNITDGQFMIRYTGHL